MRTVILLAAGAWLVDELLERWLMTRRVRAMRHELELDLIGVLARRGPQA